MSQVSERNSSDPPKARFFGGKKPPSVTGHVMLSYNSGTRQVVRNLKNQLNAEGFKTWMDEENMGPGSLLDSIEVAVSEAAVVLLCFSEGYKTSPFCRMEAEYALKLQKPLLFVKAEKNYKPDGWLAFIMGQTLYYDIAKPGISDSLIKHVKEIYGGGSNPASPESSRSPAPKSSAAVAPERTERHSDRLGVTPRTSKSESGWSNWTTNEVQEWLLQNELHFLRESYALSF